MYNSFFSHSFVFEHPSCFQILTIRNSAALNIGEWEGLFVLCFLFLDCTCVFVYPRSDIDGAYGFSISTILRHIHIVFQKGWSRHLSLQQWMRVPLFLHLWQHCLFSLVFIGYSRLMLMTGSHESGGLFSTWDLNCLQSWVFSPLFIVVRVIRSHPVTHHGDIQYLRMKTRDLPLELWFCP